MDNSSNKNNEVRDESNSNFKIENNNEKYNKNDKFDDLDDVFVESKSKIFINCS
jgi:hypothetical protein